MHVLSCCSCHKIMHQFYCSCFGIFSCKKEKHDEYHLQGFCLNSRIISPYCYLISTLSSMIKYRFWAKTKNYAYQSASLFKQMVAYLSKEVCFTFIMKKETWLQNVFYCLLFSILWNWFIREREAHTISLKFLILSKFNQIPLIFPLYFLGKTTFPDLFLISMIWQTSWFTSRN